MLSSTHMSNTNLENTLKPRSPCMDDSLINYGKPSADTFS